MGKTLFKSLISIIICSLTLSCTMLTNDYGSIDFYLPEIQSNNTRSRASIDLTIRADYNFLVTLKTMDGVTVKKEIKQPNSKVSLRNIKQGQYILNLYYEDPKFIVHGYKDVYVIAGRNNSFTVELSLEEKTVPQNPEIKPETPEELPKPDTQLPDSSKPNNPDSNNGHQEDNHTPLPDVDDGNTPSLPDVEEKPEDNTLPETPEVDNGNGENTQPGGGDNTTPIEPEQPQPEVPEENNENGEDTQTPNPSPEENGNNKPLEPDTHTPENGDTTKPDPQEPSIPDVEVPQIEYVSYFVDGTNGNDWNNDGLSEAKPFKSVKMAVSKFTNDNNYIVNVKGTVTETELIDVNKNVNVIIRGDDSGTAKIVRNSGSDVMVVGTSNGKDKNNTNILVRPTVTLENITIQGNTTARAILVYYGELHLKDGVNVLGKAPVGIQSHVGDGSKVYLGGTAKVQKKINIVGNGFITIESALSGASPNATLNLLTSSNQGNWNTSHQVVKATNDVFLATEVVKLKLGNKNYTLASDGKIAKVN